MGKRGTHGPQPGDRLGCGSGSGAQVVGEIGWLCCGAVGQEVVGSTTVSAAGAFQSGRRGTRSCAPGPRRARHP
eukprot:6866757-Pyramimonas_sp.AAC.1